MEAQRFPADYDGIVAGAPANNWTRLMAGDFDATLAVLKDPASNLPASALGVLYRGSARGVRRRATASRTACSKIRAGAISIRRRCSARRVRRPEPA